MHGTIIVLYVLIFVFNAMCLFFQMRWCNFEKAAADCLILPSISALFDALSCSWLPRYLNLLTTLRVFPLTIILGFGLSYFG